MTLADRLFAKAQRHELTAAFEEERGEILTALASAAMASVLYEIVDALRAEADAGEASSEAA